MLTFVALNALGGGTYGVLGAEGVPVSLLEGSPFTDYFWPSVILLVGVGGSHGVAAAAVWRRARAARPAAGVAGLVLLGWIAAQVAVIGFVSWLQPAMAVAATTTLWLAWRLPAYHAPSA